MFQIVLVYVKHRMNSMFIVLCHVSRPVHSLIKESSQFSQIDITFFLHSADYYKKVEKKLEQSKISCEIAAVKLHERIPFVRNFRSHFVSFIFSAQFDLNEM